MPLDSAVSHAHTNEVVANSKQYRAIWLADAEPAEKLCTSWIMCGFLKGTEQRLRKQEKLEDQPGEPRLFHTVRNVGYRLVTAEELG